MGKSIMGKEIKYKGPARGETGLGSVGGGGWTGRSAWSQRAYQTHPQGNRRCLRNFKEGPHGQATVWGNFCS